MQNSSGQGFPSTDWKLVQCAGGEPSMVRHEALGTLLRRYLPALRTHLTSRRRVTAQQAEDLVQAFLTSKIIEENLIARARAERGRFRNLLRKALDDFSISQRRHDRAKKRSPGKLAPLTDAAPVVDDALDPQSTFEVAWAREVLAEAVRRMEAECAQSRRADLWGVFESRILLPIVDGAAPPRYEDLIERLGFRSPLQAANALTTAKRMFERNLREILAEYAGDADRVEDEIRDLRAILARANR